MIATTRASLTRTTALLLACAACFAVLPLAVAAGAEGTVTYTHESLQEFEKQLAAKQIQAVTINKRVRSLRVTLKDGRHVLARYERKGEPKVAAALAAKGVPVTVLKPAAAAKEVPKKAHKLRYIAGGILILVIVVVGTVLYVDRRRKRRLD
jgi:hypothetical protein